MVFSLSVWLNVRDLLQYRKWSITVNSVSGEMGVENDECYDNCNDDDKDDHDNYRYAVEILMIIMCYSIMEQ